MNCQLETITDFPFPNDVGTLGTGFQPNLNTSILHGAFLMVTTVDSDFQELQWFGNSVAGCPKKQWEQAFFSSPT